MTSVIVVGAGPAGATAARTIARAGVTVRLLDRSNFPRNKPCGGGISYRVFRRFPYLRAELPRIAIHAVSRLHLEGPDGDETVIESAEPAALLIRRVEFDALLVSLATEAGAEFVGGADIVMADTGDHGVSLTARDGRRFEASMVIAADGVHSGVARRLGLRDAWRRDRVALDMMEETPRATLRDVDPATMWVSYGHEPAGASAKGSRSAAEGYAYVFPKRDHVNVGVGYVLDHYDREIGTQPYTLQRGFVDELRRRGVVDGESSRRDFTPFLIPVGGPMRRPGRGRVMLAGDAGGFVNGFTAEGIYYAMVSGELAARAAVSTQPGQEASVADRYCAAVHREVGSELRDSVLLRRYLFADRRRIARIVQSAGREAPATRAIIDFALGKMSYGALRFTLLARAPLLAAQLIWEWGRSKVVGH